MCSKIIVSVLSGIAGMALSAASTAEAAPILHYGYSAPVYEGSNPPVLLSGGIQTGTIDETGLYRVTVGGASGAAGIKPGGIGALVAGELFMEAGASFTVLVGGNGRSGFFGNRGGGGGGGLSYFSLKDSEVLAVAGGGGGGGGDYGGDLFQGAVKSSITTAGRDGSATESGLAGRSLFEAIGGSGGVDGAGGGAGGTFDATGAARDGLGEPLQFGGGGGAGFKGDGEGFVHKLTGEHQKFGGLTGPSWWGSRLGSDGGFGGGGSGNEFGGGGGGGYGGGGGGAAGIGIDTQSELFSVGLGGGGGGSFLSPIFMNPLLKTGGATDGAFVSVELLSPAETPTLVPLPPTAALLAAALAALVTGARLCRS